MNEIEYIPSSNLRPEFDKKRDDKNMSIMWNQLWTLIQALIGIQVAIWTLHMPIIAFVIAIIVVWFIYKINKI